ncbi:class D sortase [Silvibacterium acidisoli]|uniref:class D sortase n=1 Tax=Acidobacteriaceae bacterium ZG23-2 TaxID=2883246 RepID=UPI00406CBF41
MGRFHTARWSRIAEPGLWIVSALVFCWLAVQYLSAHGAARVAAHVADVHQAQDGVIGQMTIPALHLAVPMTSGIEKADLLRGVGHIPGTALPGGLGTVGLAGHRDTYLRPLKAIRKGMVIQLAGANGAYLYSVDSTEIVTPDQTRVLDIQSRPALTLVTCYPFYYVGSAPQRFIVHAHLLSVVASSHR